MGQLIFSDVSKALPDSRVDVSFVVKNTAAILASVPKVDFSYAVGEPPPSARQVVVVVGQGSSEVNASTPGVAWLSVSSKLGRSPFAFNISVNPNGLTAGQYTSSITVTAADATPLSIPITLTVTAPASPQIATIFNATTMKSGPIAPGELLTIKGLGLGPVAGVTAAPTSGTYGPILTNTRVYFDLVPGIPLFVRSDQVNLVVPFEIAGRYQVSVTVEVNGVRSAGVTMLVQDVAPGLFTVSATGTGQLSALNQDSTINGIETGQKRAVPGSIIQLFGTGAGQTTPSGQTGSISSTKQVTLLPVSAKIAGMPATINFSGQAPSMISGLWQVNVTVPSGLPVGNHEVLVSVGGVSTQSGATVAVGQ
jgi:uncharacterized protein (TIGR03437 family)